MALVLFLHNRPMKQVICPHRRKGQKRKLGSRKATQPVSESTRSYPSLKPEFFTLRFGAFLGRLPARRTSSQKTPREGNKVRILTSREVSLKCHLTQLSLYIKARMILIGLKCFYFHSHSFQLLINLFYFKFHPKPSVKGEDCKGRGGI